VETHRQASLQKPPGLFQKNLVVWKQPLPRFILHIRPVVSEELSSVETKCQTEFTKKRSKGFRRT